MTEATIRPATPDDAEALVRFIVAAGEGLPLVLWAGMAEPGETPGDVGLRRARRGEGSFSYRNAVVAEAGGAVVGSMLGYPLAPEPVAIGADFSPVLVGAQQLENLAAPRWYLNVLAVDADHRGQGVGRRLVEAAEAMARAGGYPGVAIIAFDVNVDARRLYGRLGYGEVSRRPVVPLAGWGFDGAEWVLLTKDF